MKNSNHMLGDKIDWKKFLPTKIHVDFEDPSTEMNSPTDDSMTPSPDYLVDAAADISSSDSETEAFVYPDDEMSTARARRAFKKSRRRARQSLKKEPALPLVARIPRGETARPVVSKTEVMEENFIVVNSANVDRKRTFNEFTFRGFPLEALVNMPTIKCTELLGSRARRKMKRAAAIEATGVVKTKHTMLFKKIMKAKKDAVPGEKPRAVRTHLRDFLILPEIIGSIIHIHNGKSFNPVELKPEMIGHYLGEFSITYKPIKHGRPGIGATHSSRFIPLK